METQTPVIPEPSPIEIPQQPTPDLSAGASLEDLGLSSSAPLSATQVDEGGEVVTMGLDDESVKAYDFELYSGRRGQTDRLSLIDPAQIFSARVHFKQGAGYFICHSKFTRQQGQELMTHEAQCCKKGESPRKRFAVLIVQYATSSDGSMVNPLGFVLKLWRFSEDKYVLLRNVHRNYPLTQHDLLVTCSEEKFQKLALQNAKECVWRLPKFPPAYKAQIDLFVKANTPKALKALGKKLSPQELLERLGLAQAPTMVQSQLPIADLSDLLPTT